MPNTAGRCQTLPLAQHQAWSALRRHPPAPSPWTRARSTLCSLLGARSRSASLLLLLFLPALSPPSLPAQGCFAPGGAPTPTPHLLGARTQGTGRRHPRGAGTSPSRLPQLPREGGSLPALPPGPSIPAGRRITGLTQPNPRRKSPGLPHHTDEEPVHQERGSQQATRCPQGVPGVPPVSPVPQGGRCGCRGHPGPHGSTQLAPCRAQTQVGSGPSSQPGVGLLTLTPTSSGGFADRGAF